MLNRNGQKHITVSVDAMGGDNAPASVVEGVSVALAKIPNLDVILYGDQKILTPLITQCRIDTDRCTVVHTDEFVKADDKPSLVVRHGRNTSMWLSIAAVRDGKADAVVSAGNTGALMVMAKFCLATMKSILRPAICTAIPNENKRVVMLDLGANAECSDKELVQFAFMGAIYAHALFGIEKPRVGLLNIGSEETKGLDNIKSAATQLRNMADVPFEFKGFAEGTDIFPGKFDVIATDGFSGNIALKTMEGSVRFLMHAIKRALKSSWLAKLGILFILPALLGIKRDYNPNNYNGAMLMGLNGIVVKSHGAANTKAFANAVCAAYSLADKNVIERLKLEVAKTVDVATNSSVAPSPVSEN